MKLLLIKLMKEKKSHTHAYYLIDSLNDKQEIKNINNIIKSKWFLRNHTKNNKKKVKFNLKIEKDLKIHF